MKHAFLIMAHNEPAVLRTLLAMLDDPRNDVYLHIDRRADALRKEMEGTRLRRAGLHVVPRPLRAYWGDISLVETEYLLLEAASSVCAYDYYHLLSGTDLPIQTQDTIHAFFRAHAGREFVSYWHGPWHDRDLDRKVSRYYFLTRHLKRSHSPWHAVAAPLHNLALLVQKAFGLRRRHEVEFRKGAQWFSITHGFCRYLIGHKDFVLRRFRHTLCPDEIFVQTLLWNSPFRNRIYNAEDDNTGNMRLIDWQRGNPYTWRDEDWEELRQSDKLFARKFSGEQADLMRRLEASYAPAAGSPEV